MGSAAWTSCRSSIGAASTASAAAGWSRSGYDPATAGSASTTRCCAGEPRSDGSSRRWGCPAARTRRPKPRPAGGRRWPRRSPCRRSSRSRVFATRRASAAIRLDYLAAVEEVIGRIDRGDFYQINLCLRLHARPPPRSRSSSRDWPSGSRPRTPPWYRVRAARWRRRSVRSCSCGSRSRRHDGADQGHRPARRRRSRRDAAAGVGQGRGREHHDHRPDAQRPVAGLPAGQVAVQRAAQRATPSRGLAPGLDRVAGR